VAKLVCIGGNTSRFRKVNPLTSKGSNSPTIFPSSQQVGSSIALQR
jgi:hypothetical protein